MPAKGHEPKNSWCELDEMASQIGAEGSDPQSTTEQADSKYGGQSNNPSEAAMHKDHVCRQL